MVAEFNKQQQRSFGPATLVDSLPAEQRVQSSTHAARRKAEAEDWDSGGDGGKRGEGWW